MEIAFDSGFCLEIYMGFEVDYFNGLNIMVQTGILKGRKEKEIVVPVASCFNSFISI